jgi:hypothetical protein
LISIHTTTPQALLAALHPLGKMQQRLVDILHANHGAFVPCEDIITGLWGDDEDGGPLNARNVLSVMVHKLRLMEFKISAARKAYALAAPGASTTPRLDRSMNRKRTIESILRTQKRIDMADAQQIFDGSLNADKCVHSAINNLRREGMDIQAITAMNPRSRPKVVGYMLGAQP